jgi:dolichyl-phosphate beta-glucosyltransferase
MSTAIIVVPCYNEAQRLNVARFHGFASGRPGVRFLMVNDGSRDETLMRLQQLEAEDAKHFSVLDLPRNGGKAEAIRQGVLYAAEERPDFIGYWDADLATPLDAIPTFVDVLRRRHDVSLVIGTRLPLLGHDIRRRPIRRLLGRVFASVASLTLGTKIRVIAIQIQNEGDPISSLLYELPLDSWEDIAGSRLKRSDFVKAIGDLSRIWWRYLRPGAAAYSPPTPVVAKPERRRAA